MDLMMVGFAKWDMHIDALNDHKMNILCNELSFICIMNRVRHRCYIHIYICAACACGKHIVEICV
jgi:hypothetical protein